MLQLHMVWLHMEGPWGWQVEMSEMFDTLVQYDEEHVGVKKAETSRNLGAGDRAASSPEILGHRNIKAAVDNGKTAAGEDGHGKVTEGKWQC